VYLAAVFPTWVTSRRAKLQQGVGVDFTVLSASDDEKVPGISSAQLFVICGFSFGVIGAVYGHNPVEMSLISVFMIAAYSAAAIDSRFKLLFDDLVQPMLWIGLVVNSFSVFVSLHEAVAGVLLGFLFMWLVSAVAKLFTSKASVGRGDLKFMAAIGGWFGYQVVLPTLWLASITLVFFVVICRVFKRDMSDGNEYAMGPFLAISAMMVQLVAFEVLRLKDLLTPTV